MTTHTDSHQSYFSKLGRLRVLTRDEERALVEEYHATKDRRVFDKLVEGNLRFVVSLAKRYIRYGFELMELVQEGNLGLVQAIERFDPGRDTRLVTYAAWWIKARIHDYIISNWSIVKIGSSRLQREVFTRVLRGTKVSEPEHIEATVHRIADALEVSPRTVERIVQRIVARDDSLERAVTPDGTVALLDLIPTEGSSTEELVTEQERSRKVLDAITTLLGSGDSRFGKIISARYLSDDGASLEAIGQDIGLSKERIRQLETEAISAIRSELDLDNRRWAA